MCELNLCKAERRSHHRQCDLSLCSDPATDTCQLLDHRFMSKVRHTGRQTDQIWLQAQMLFDHRQRRRAARQIKKSKRKISSALTLLINSTPAFMSCKQASRQRRQGLRSSHTLCCSSVLAIGVHCELPSRLNGTQQHLAIFMDFRLSWRILKMPVMSSCWLMRTRYSVHCSPRAVLASSHLRMSCVDTLCDRREFLSCWSRGGRRTATSR